MDEMISMFIDNELSIDDKMFFVKRLKGDPDFFDETLALLDQDKLLRAEGLFPAPELAVKAPGVAQGRLQAFLKDFLGPLVGPVGVMAVVAVVVLGIVLTDRPGPPSGVCSSRLVVYQPEAREVAVAGAFTDWKAVSMHAAGSSGYWEIRLDIPRGEHGFVYIADGHRRFVDPTILTREQDDFGGENSILIVGQSI
ncbi:MAG: glycogen-binding domain-containing protein [Desulfobacterium sp.]|nr:glycogen-binding domain-containing protein [Desulfobacterium sp.]